MIHKSLKTLTKNHKKVNHKKERRLSKTMQAKIVSKNLKVTRVNSGTKSVVCRSHK